MTLPIVNNVAVLVSGVAIFMLGGLWYSPVLFAKRWVKLIGKTEEERARRDRPVVATSQETSHFGN